MMSRAEIVAMRERGLSVREIADAVGSTPAAVYQMLRRARLARPAVDARALLDRVRGPFALGLSLTQLHREIARWAKANRRRPIGLATLRRWSSGAQVARTPGPVDVLLEFARATGITP